VTLVIQGETGQTGVSGWALFAVPLVRGLGVGAAQINNVSLFLFSLAAKRRYRYRIVS
jgi:hypothetical protein